MVVAGADGARHLRVSERQRQAVFSGLERKREPGADTTKARIATGFRLYRWYSTGAEGLEPPTPGFETGLFASQGAWLLLVFPHGFHAGLHGR